LKVSELLAERVSFGRDAADDTVRCSQLLHHHVEMAVESAESGIPTRIRQGRRRVLLLAARSLQGVGAAVGFLARQADGNRFGRCDGNIRGRYRITR
jgi:hypothetical protein